MNFLNVVDIPDLLQSVKFAEPGCEEVSSASFIAVTVLHLKQEQLSGYSISSPFNSHMPPLFTPMCLRF